jgi:hypothetical protein
MFLYLGLSRLWGALLLFEGLQRSREVLEAMLLANHPALAVLRFNHPSLLS